MDVNLTLKYIKWRNFAILGQCKLLLPTTQIEGWVMVIHYKLRAGLDFRVRNCLLSLILLNGIKGKWQTYEQYDTPNLAQQIKLTKPNFCHKLSTTKAERRLLNQCHLFFYRSRTAIVMGFLIKLPLLVNSEAYICMCCLLTSWNQSSWYLGENAKVSFDEVKYRVNYTPPP